MLLKLIRILEHSKVYQILTTTFVCKAKPSMERFLIHIVALLMIFILYSILSKVTIFINYVSNEIITLQGKGDRSCHFRIRKNRFDGYFVLESVKFNGMCLSVQPDMTTIVPQVDVGDDNVQFRAKVVECMFNGFREF